MKKRSFLSFFRREKAPEDLPLSTRVSTLEGDVLSMRAQVDSIHTTTRKLQGKVYRGIPLGLTKDADPPPEPPQDEKEVIPMEPAPPTFRSKTDLYRAASHLRGR